jgi:hypothetical protein
VRQRERAALSARVVVHPHGDAFYLNVRFAPDAPDLISGLARLLARVGEPCGFVFGSVELADTFHGSEGLSIHIHIQILFAGGLLRTIYLSLPHGIETVRDGRVEFDGRLGVHVVPLERVNRLC